MLPEPPCINGMIGCDNGDGYQGSGSSGTTGSEGGTGGSGSAGTSSSRGLQNYPSFGYRSSSSSSSGFGSTTSSSGAASTGGSFFGQGSGGSENGASSSSSRSSIFGSSGAGSSGSPSSRSSIFGASGSSSSRSSIFGSGTQSSRSSSEGGGSSFVQTASSEAQRYGDYVLSVVNRGTENLKNVVTSHGPVPSGAQFDPSRSSQGCTQVGTTVECVTDLSAGESKQFSLAYKMKDSVSCALARSLQTAKATVSGTSSTGLSTDVTCSMETVTAVASSASAGSSEVASGAYGGSGSSIQPFAAATGSVAPGLIVGQTDAGSFKGKGYKPYPMPRTGAADSLFASTSDFVAVPMHNLPNQSHFFSIVVTLSILIVLAGFCLVVKNRLFI